MELETFMLADAAYAGEGKLYIHGGGVTRINPPQLPWLQPQIAVVVVFAVQPEDVGRGHRIGLTFTAPGGDIMGPVLDQMIGPIERSPNLLPGEQQHAQILLTVSPISLPRPGTYRFNLTLDGEPVGHVNLAVAPPTGGISAVGRQA